MLERYAVQTRSSSFKNNEWCYWGDKYSLEQAIIMRNELVRLKATKKEDSRVIKIIETIEVIND